MTMGDQFRLSKLNLVIYNRAMFLLNPSKKKDGKSVFACDNKKQRKVLEFGQERLQISEKENNDNLDQ